MVSFFGCGRISLIGHYSKDGLRMRSRLGDHATEMFWLLEDTVAFGGRAALLPLLYHTCRAIFRKIPPSKHGSIQSADCTACKGPKAVFFRSASMDLEILTWINQIETVEAIRSVSFVIAVLCSRI